MSKNRILMLVSAFAAALCVCGARAEDRTVSTAQELYEAITNLNGTGSTVKVSPGNYDVSPYSMGYWTGKGVWDATVFSHLSMSNLTVSGISANPRDTVIYGDRTLSIFRCHLASLQNLTVSNGLIAAADGTGYGGGVYNTGTSSIHSNVVVTCCSLEVKKGNGGGVYSGTWYDSTIISNSAWKNNGGGACIGTYYNCNIISNTATATGGGLYYGVKLHNCRIIGNRARTGGGIGSTETGSTNYVYGGVIADNYAATGGGSAYAAIFYGGTLVSNNVATDEGGGIYLGKIPKEGEPSHEAIVSNAVICCNTGATGGGCANGTVVGCEIFGNTANNGGGVSGSRCENCTITNNLATGEHGGGCNGGTYTNCLIACNSLLSESTTSVSGGGLYGGVAIGCMIVSNTVGTLSTSSKSAASGGGAASSQIIDSLVMYNQATGGVQNALGGGLYYGSASNCFIAGNAVWGGAQERQGGGADHTALTNCIVCNNVAAIGTGLNYGSAYGCVISNNVSPNSAAATMVRRPAWVENCDIVGISMMACWAKNSRFVNFTNGAYIAEGENIHYSGHFSGSSSPTLLSTGLSMTNCLIAGNKCASGGLFASSATKGIDLVNCTIADNELSSTFYYTTNGIPGVIENCIFVGNKTTGGTTRNLWYSQSATNLWLSNCLIGSGRASYAPRSETGTVTNDIAGFVKGEGRDRYALRYSSPARGKGLVQDWMTGALDIRQDPACPRLRDGAVDIGCYQCWLDPVGFTFSVR